MKICYVVYREDNVLVFDSQVLEYLRNLEHTVPARELIVFRHEQNLFKKQQVEAKLLNYVPKCRTFASLPVLSIAQLHLAGARLRHYVKKAYRKDEEIAVICRGELATYVAAKAFKGYRQSRILFDNRGLPFEESQSRYGDRFIYKRNRNAKKKALQYAKDHCDMYNFVTNNLRRYDIDTYGYSESKPYTIIPTLYSEAPSDALRRVEITDLENYSAEDFVVTYIGSTAAWQSTEQLKDLLLKLDSAIPNVRFFMLTNGQIPGLETLPASLASRITIKQVKHSDIPYYLQMSDVGILIRDKSIINKVAAPTKAAEYLMNRMCILYQGEIGIFDDIRPIRSKSQIIDMEKNADWLSRVVSFSKSQVPDEHIVSYFDMAHRQLETLDMFKQSFQNEKKRPE